MRLQHLARSAARASHRPTPPPARLSECAPDPGFRTPRQRFDEHGVLGRESRAARARRFRSGSVRNSRNAPGCFTIPSTVRARTVASQSARTPFAFAARQIDLAHDALPDPARIVRFHHFTHKLMARRSAKSVIAALQFEIRVADSAVQAVELARTLPDAAAAVHCARNTLPFSRQTETISGIL